MNTDYVFVKSKDLNLDKCLKSGEIFGWQKVNDSWYGLINNKPVKLTRDGGFIEFTGAVTKAEVHQYFDLSLDYSTLFNGLTLTPYEQYVIDNARGIRVCHELYDKAVITSLITPRNTIENAENQFRRICKAYGKTYKIDDVEIYSCPTIEELRNVSVNDFKALGLGFHSTHLHDTIYRMNFVATRDIKRSDEEELEYLKSFSGVGDKVAKCIMLFGEHRLSQFPIDVHIGRVVERYDINHSKYEQYAGIMMLFMYYAERSK